MLNDPSLSKKNKKLLIITSSGGGGLIQTANAKEQEALAKDPSLVIVRRDLLRDWFWKPIGGFFINFWNKAQMSGNIPIQTLLGSWQVLFDLSFHPIIFFYALYTFLKEDVDYIIDTQNLCTSAIVKALRVYNWKRKKQIRLEKVLVDMPTRKATHFFRPIRKLSKKNKKLIQLTSIKPLLEIGETAEEFWKSTCGLPESAINIEDVYVRQAFRAYKGKDKPTELMRIKIKYKNSEELHLMKKAFSRGSIPYRILEQEVEFHIAAADRMVTILLGSQPANEATLNYVKRFVSFAKEFPKVCTHLFVFCADHTSGEKSLFQKVADFAARVKNYPKKLTIIPFSFQKEDVIAPLFFRSDITCTRSGGQTAMELMCVSTGQIWIHSEAKKGQDLLSGIPVWEAASALYLQKIRGVKILTPDTFIPHARQVYQTNNGQTFSSREFQSTA